MSKYPIFILCPLLLILTGCMLHLLNGYEYEYSEQYELVGKILEKTSKKLEKKYQMSTCGSGIGMPNGIVGMLALSFEKVGPLTKDEGRKIVVNCVQEMMNAVNTNEQIRPFLKNFPFKPTNVEIAIFLRDKSRDFIYEPDYGIISATNGDVNYRFTKIENPLRFSADIEENFDDALKSVQSQ